MSKAHGRKMLHKMMLVVVVATNAASGIEDVYAQNGQDIERNSSAEPKRSWRDVGKGAVGEGANVGARIISKSIACVIAGMINPNAPPPAECQGGESPDGGSEQSESQSYPPAPQRPPYRPEQRAPDQRDQRAQDRGDRRTSDQRGQHTTDRPEQRVPDQRDQRTSDSREQHTSDLRDQSTPVGYLRGFWCVKDGIGNYEFRPTADSDVTIYSLRTGAAPPITWRATYVSSNVIRLESSDGVLGLEAIDRSTMKMTLSESQNAFLVRCGASGPR